MSSPGRLVAAIVGVVLFAGGALAQGQAPLGRVEAGSPAPGFDILGADGARHTLEEFKGRAVVLEWTSPVCPYTAMKYARGTIQRLQRLGARSGVAWLVVDTAAKGRSGYLDPNQARRRVSATKARITNFLLDTDGRLGRLYGARVTPSFFVINKDHRLVYQGALDNGPDADKKRGPDYLESALNALAAGRSIKVSEVRPYGCAVEY